MAIYDINSYRNVAYELLFYACVRREERGRCITVLPYYRNSIDDVENGMRRLAKGDNNANV